jgi:hypothetical protein
MSELTSTAAAEASALKDGGEASHEDHSLETRQPETHSAVETQNTTITDYINDGLLPAQIENRLQHDLQNPEVQRQLIEEFSPYSERITPYIRTIEELSVYMRNGLQESTVCDRPCLLMKIDPERCDAMGRSNVERTAVGRAAVDENSDAVNLHHIGQKEDSPLAELPQRVHKESDGILHDKTIPTEIHGDGTRWDNQRVQHWRERSLTL